MGSKQKVKTTEIIRLNQLFDIGQPKQSDRVHKQNKSEGGIRLSPKFIRILNNIAEQNGY
ncbi:hypothetical protein QMU85_002774 [Photobacterium damselae]|nr:hypothetical protein [Photobacterium damselae]